MADTEKGGLPTIQVPIVYPVPSHQVAVEEIKTKTCGLLNVKIQGDLERENPCVFLTVHDMGSNQESMVEFTQQPAMAAIANRCVFIHIGIPGQEKGAADLETFPSMQELGEQLVMVVDQLKVPLVLGLGEGAGANILARFGMAHPTRVLGLVLVHPTSTTAGVMEQIKDKIIDWKLGTVGHNPTATQYLIFHKFGKDLVQASDKQKALEEFKEKLHKDINPRNLWCFVESFMNRTDISGLLGEHLKCDTLLIVGDNSSFVHTTETMHQHSNKAKTSILRIDDVGDVLGEAPEKVSQSVLLFCQGIGLLTSISIVERTRTSSEGDKCCSNLDMEGYDRPNIKRFSFSSRGEREADEMKIEN